MKTEPLIPSKPNLLFLFQHPKFESTLYPEDEIIETPKSRHELYAWRIIHFWESTKTKDGKGLRAPRRKNKLNAHEKALSELIAVMKGNHLHVQKYSSDQIMKAVSHLLLAAYDPEFMPIKSGKQVKKLRSLDIPHFIYDKYTGTSYLKIYQDPPKTLYKELNSYLTRMIKNYFAAEKWGHTASDKDIGLEHEAAFIKTSNRLHEYLVKHEKYFQPAMRLSIKNPERAVYGMMCVCKTSKNWAIFEPHWLANDVTFTKLDVWLRDQGFYRSPNTVEKPLNKIETLR
jgi:hypothetical protein